MAVDLAIVPVAGRGTRLLPLTKSQPKEMLPVGEKPVVQYVAEELAHSGVRRLLFVTGPGKTAIENHFDEDAELITFLRENGQETLLRKLSFERMQLQYFYTRQRRQLGLGHAILCAQPMAAREPFVVALGDSIIGLHAQSDIVRRMIALFEEQRADGVIAFEQVPREEVIHYGIASVGQQHDDHFELDNLVEKPGVQEAPSQLAVASRYVFTPRLFDYLKRTAAGKGNEIQLTDAISGLIRDGGLVLGVCLPPDERRYDIGNFDTYFRSFTDFALADPTYGPALLRFLREKLRQLEDE
jgi:UTP--glucose-1-phosphate uridylyltransferase